MFELCLISYKSIFGSCTSSILLAVATAMDSKIESFSHQILYFRFQKQNPNIL